MDIQHILLQLISLTGSGLANTTTYSIVTPSLIIIGGYIMKLKDLLKIISVN